MAHALSTDHECIPLARVTCMSYCAHQTVEAACTETPCMPCLQDLGGWVDSKKDQLESTGQPSSYAHPEKQRSALHMPIHRSTVTGSALKLCCLALPIILSTHVPLAQFKHQPAHPTVAPPNTQVTTLITPLTRMGEQVCIPLRQVLPWVGPVVECRACVMVVQEGHSTGWPQTDNTCMKKQTQESAHIFSCKAGAAALRIWSNPCTRTPYPAWMPGREQVINDGSRCILSSISFTKTPILGLNDSIIITMTHFCHYF
eukprot:1148719-Pelagomonas_calceolata.AAC.1